MVEKKLKILAISGSLRQTSSNTAIIHWIEKKMAEQVEYRIYNGLASIPPFDDSQSQPAAVTAWKQQVEEADGVLICMPEYAFGVPGVLKNALDWTVSSVVFTNKPVAIITAASNGEKAHTAIMHTLKAIGALISSETSLLISFIRTRLNAKGEITDSNTAQQIQSLFSNLLRQIEYSQLHKA